MGTNKNQKATPVRSNEYMPKAGPKKLGSKPRKRAGVSSRTDLPLFSAIAKDCADQKAVERQRLEADQFNERRRV